MRGAAIFGLHGPRDGNGRSNRGDRINGLIMQAKSLLDANKRPTGEQIKQALAHNVPLRRPRARRPAPFTPARVLAALKTA